VIPCGAGGLTESDGYRERWGDRFALTSFVNRQAKFENDPERGKDATSVGRSAMGERADVVVVDDPHDIEQAESDAERYGSDSAPIWD
jgi:hypothetical protein